jgi:hypothetical protein
LKDKEVPMDITELNACICFARACNNLDPEVFIPILASDAVYDSRLLAEKLSGRRLVADYLSEVMGAMRKDNFSMNAQLARVFDDASHIIMPDDPTKQGRDCVWITQGEDENLLRFITFKVEGEYVKRVEVSHPYSHHYSYGLTGKYPI